MCAVLELKIEPNHATAILRRVLQGHDDFPLLRRENGPGELTVLHLVGASDLDQYQHRARAWASAVWSAWESHHALIHDAVTVALS